MRKSVIILTFVLFSAISLRAEHYEECCKETCDTMDCHDDLCVYKQVTCIRAPCCPIAKCVPRDEEPELTCRNAKCASRCRLVQEAGCNDVKTCAGPSCLTPENGGIPFCPPTE